MRLDLQMAFAKNEINSQIEGKLAGSCVSSSSTRKAAAVLEKASVLSKSAEQFFVCLSILLQLNVVLITQAALANSETESQFEDKLAGLYE